MSIFFFDETLYDYEERFQWDQALAYLENLFLRERQATQQYSLIGFSWLYLIEGPVISNRYENDKTEFALEMWKKYIDMGVQQEHNASYFNFIAGYTLSMHGYLISEEYERLGSMLMKRCAGMYNNEAVRELAENFMVNETSPKYIPLIKGNAICDMLFNGHSLLDKYFCEIYNC